MSEPLIFRVGKKERSLGPRVKWRGTQCRLEAVKYVYEKDPADISHFAKLCQTTFNTKEGIRNNAPFDTLKQWLEPRLPDHRRAMLLDELKGLRDSLSKTHRNKCPPANAPSCYDPEWWENTPTQTADEIKGSTK